MDAQERVVKHSDIYIINGSDVSKASSKASNKSKMSKKSSNYDPLPLNGIDKVKQRKLTEEEIERERREDKEQNARRMSSASKERKPKAAKDPTKGSVKSKGSWTNEEFAALYEPVSADELKRKKQMRELKELRQQLKSWTPELGKTVENINTVRRKEVLRKLKAAVVRNIDLDNLSEEEIGKHLDMALSNLNLSGMYVPMEKNPSNSKAVSRENTDYDTFGSIDSLIFEPKLPTHEDIAEAQEEITQSFEYLENEDDGQMEMNVAAGRHNNNNTDNLRNIQEKVLKFEKKIPERRSPRQEKNAIAVGQTSFAERVKLFQSLGGQQNKGSVTEHLQTGESGVRRRDSPIVESAAGKSVKREKPLLTQTTWMEQASKKSDRSGRDSSASGTSVSTNSSGSTVIYNVTGTGDGNNDGNTSSFRRRGSVSEVVTKQNVETITSPAAQQDEGGALCSGTMCSECKSLVSDWSCSCYQYEDCSCVMDCSECGNTETLSRRIIEEEEDEDLESEMIIKEHIYQDNQIPIVGNLRRRISQARETQNIEKTQEKKGFIAEDEDERVFRAPSVENNGDNMPPDMKEKLKRNESFQKLQKRNQFRSVSPDVAKIDQDKNANNNNSQNLLEKYKKAGLLVEVENGVPLIYKTNQSQDSDSKCLDSPKSKGSEAGDSGVGSDPASISPKSSSSSGSSKDAEETKDKSDNNNEDDVTKNLVPPGGKKRDTMIRELKTKLKERFPSNTIESAKSIPNGSKPFSSKPNTIRNAEVGPKLTKIFDNILSENISRGSSAASVLRPHYTNGNFSHDDDEDSEDSLQQHSDTECDSSVYDPSLPPGNIKISFSTSKILYL